MTNSQSFALFCLCKADCRNLTLSVAEASGYISRAKAGEVSNIRNELLALGAVDKSNGKAVAVKQDYKAIFDEAHQAGMIAGNNCKPAPMIVQNHANPLDDSSPVTKSYYVPSGICGFAEIIIKPGNCGFAKWAKQNVRARASYYGGMSIWVHEFGQSMECKESYANAFASVLNKYGIKAYSTSRMD